MHHTRVRVAERNTPPIDAVNFSDVPDNEHAICPSARTGVAAGRVDTTAPVVNVEVTLTLPWKIDAPVTIVFPVMCNCAWGLAVLMPTLAVVTDVPLRATTRPSMKDVDVSPRANPMPTLLPVVAVLVNKRVPHPA